MNTLHQSLQYYLSSSRIAFNSYDKLYLHPQPGNIVTF